MVTNEQLAAFCTAIDAKLKAHYFAMAKGYEAEGETVEGYVSRVHGLKPCTFERGPRYTRIVRNDHQSSVFCFVDNETGSIYKAAGWKSPEPKKHIRGNIANGANDVTAHGAQYR